ncbi:hypothetical protein [Streptomyces sp. NPDC001657]|uniref:hypothetical protein n=1 Tax=Streptomyces sp. NPDC001657 TaxID=3154522 RepID=UPI003323BCA8
MAAEQVAQTVRQQLRIGRVLPLGGPANGSWITEQAAAGALRAALGTRAGVRLGTLRLSVADPVHAPDPAVPAPPSALPPGPLRIDAEFTAVADRPLPAVADEVRAALLEASVQGLGLVVAAVDLRVTGLLEDAGAGRAGPALTTVRPEKPPVTAEPAGVVPEGPEALAAAALAVSGVARLAPVLGGRTRAVRRTDGHVLVQLAVAAGYRPLDVAVAVRQAVAARPGPPHPGAVHVTAVERD